MRYRNDRAGGFVPRLPADGWAWVALVAIAGAMTVGLLACGGGADDPAQRDVDLGAGITLTADGAILVAAPRGR